mgnify:CR=1 FL=1
MVYKWIGADGGWKVGTIVQEADWSLLSGTLMRHSHTGELEWVDTDALSEYCPVRKTNPSDPTEDRLADLEANGSLEISVGERKAFDELKARILH